MHTGITPRSVTKDLPVHVLRDLLVRYPPRFPCFHVEISFALSSTDTPSSSSSCINKRGRGRRWCILIALITARTLSLAPSDEGFSIILFTTDASDMVAASSIHSVLETFLPYFVIVVGICHPKSLFVSGRKKMERILEGGPAKRVGKRKERRGALHWIESNLDNTFYFATPPATFFYSREWQNFTSITPGNKREHLFLRSTTTHVPHISLPSCGSYPAEKKH